MNIITLNINTLRAMIKLTKSHQIVTKAKCLYGHAIAPLFLLIQLSGFTGCSDGVVAQETKQTCNDCFTLKAGEQKEIAINNKKYVIKLEKIDDQRCLMSATAFGDYGIKISLSVFPLDSIDKTKNVTLFSPFCRDDKVTNVSEIFQGNYRDRGMSQVTHGFLVGLFDASPHQYTNPPKKIPIEDYRITLTTQPYAK